MHFHLKINPSDDQLIFKPDSALVKFFFDSGNLATVIDEFFLSLNYPLGKIQRKTILEKKSDEVIYYSQNGEPSVIFIKKIKLDADFTSDFFRDYFAGLMPNLKKKNLRTVHVVAPAFKELKKYFESERHLLQSMLEGIHLGNYTFDNYKSDRKKTDDLNFLIHYTDQKILKKSIENSGKIMSAVYFTRDLVNEPANTLTPPELAARTKKELIKLGIKVTVFEKNELKKRKMNAILAVGGASSNPPSLITMHYKPSVKPRRKIALVGKGVCYDSGGLSLKPTSSMLEMKADMAGGGAVIGIMKAAAMMKLPVEIIGVVPAVENMVGGSSYKPGDIVVASSGKSIEVKDTDAEGRIVLADALHYVSQMKPDEIIDFATLTGACVVALGEIAAGLFTQNDSLAENLLQSGSLTYERLWRMPFWNDYNKMIKSEIADVSNLGQRWGGAITAGKFLEKFVDEKIPWAHIDLAGPAIKHKSNNYTEKYDTGFGVRLMVEYLSKI